MTLRIFDHNSETFHADVAALRDKLRGGGLTAAGAGQLDVPAIVADILQKVADGGDAAAAELANRLDRAELSPEAILVPAGKIKQAHAAADKDFLRLMRRVIANIREYQEAILHPDPPAVHRGGRQLGVRYTPIDRVGVYVPGGTALYPSTVLMTVVPAQVAGVKEIVLASPPTTDGDIHPMVLALAGELDVREVVRLGGAVAMAAMAYGSETLRPVQKIVGPGNAFVAEAKRQLFGRVGIDSIAGPSEVLIVADASAEADWIAADLLAQAEHDPGSAVLITDSASLAEKVVAAVEARLTGLERADAARAALAAYSAVLVTYDMDQACDLANDFATEHLQIMTADDDAMLKRIRHAGAIFVGGYTPVPLGDYYAGPSHVLPTGGTAKFFGPLSCNDFRKASSLIHYDAASVAADTADVVDFARREGLTAHAQAVEARASRRS